MRTFVAATLLLLLAIPVSAQTSLLEWGDGPAKWIMTRDEAQGWKSVKTEEAARNFIDLFWARRDPTPGTYANEYRAEHDSLVGYADAHFRESRRRGALTERGRVLIALGMPTKLTNNEPQVSSIVSGGRQLANRTVFLWEHDDAVKKFNLPAVEVVFVHDRNGNANRDTMRNDFVNALPAAIQRSIRNPELTAAPEWAVRPEVTTKAGGSLGQVVIEGEAIETTPAKTKKTTQVSVDQPIIPLPAGAGKLTLVKDAFAIDTQGEDPFRKLASVGKFRNGDELGFVMQLCTGVVSEEPPTVMMGVRISGTINGEAINMTAPAEEVVPDSIKASAGCHLVRGAVPVADMSAGTYQLAVTLSSGGRSYNLTREFQVE
jgi:GWxTD domain-containing protein